MAEQERDVNCINCRIIYEYLRKNAPDQSDRLFNNLPEKYQDLPDPKSYLLDENNWVSSELVVRLFENAKEILRDPDAPYRIGFDSVANRSLGSIQKFFLTRFTSPNYLISRINHINTKFNTTKVVETVYRTYGKVVLKFHWRQAAVLTRDICRYNQGIYSAVFTIWGLSPGKVEEQSCYFHGDPYCQLTLRYDSRRGLLRAFFYRMFQSRNNLFDALEHIEHSQLLLKNKYEEVNTLNAELRDKIRKLKATHDASNLLVSLRDAEVVLQMTMGIIVDVLGFDRAILMMLDAEEKYLEYRYSVGTRLEDSEVLSRYRVPVSRTPNVLAEVARTGKPLLVRDVNDSGLNPSNLILREFRPDAFVICPLSVESRIIGVIAADRRPGNKVISEDDLDCLATFANAIAASIKRNRLDEELQQSYLESVKALVHALEEKDAYTSGHSQRVAELSAAIGREMGLSDSEVEFLRTGAILHDIGKLGIPESIVRNPKQLTRSERKIIELHPIKGVEILHSISFLRDYLYLIRNHHERYDGRGYPDGLAAEQIPLGARIVAVADAFDAMTSSRPYRRGISIKEAMQEISAGSGSQFHPAAVEAFKRVIESRIVIQEMI